MAETKIFALFLPFLAAVFYGLSYAMTEKVMKDSGISTYMLASCFTGIIAVLAVHFLTPFKINFSALIDIKSSSMIFVATWITTFAWLATLFAIKGISANYAAIGEISYPLFTVLFGYLFFNRTIDWSLALGALLIIGGSFLIVSDRLKG